VKTTNEIAELITRYVLGMLNEHRYIELKIRLNALVELLEMLDVKGYDSFSEDIVETMCFYQPLEKEDGNASDV